MLLQMGFWAMFMGWMYNDFTGVSIGIFPSCYYPQTPVLNKLSTTMLRKEDCL